MSSSSQIHEKWSQHIIVVAFEVGGDGGVRRSEAARFVVQRLVEARLVDGADTEAVGYDPEHIRIDSWQLPNDRYADGSDSEEMLVWVKREDILEGIA